MYKLPEECYVLRMAVEQIATNTSRSIWFTHGVRLTRGIDDHLKKAYCVHCQSDVDRIGFQLMAEKSTLTISAWSDQRRYLSAHTRENVTEAANDISSFRAFVNESVDCIMEFLYPSDAAFEPAPAGYCKQIREVMIFGEMANCRFILADGVMKDVAIPIMTALNVRPGDYLAYDGVSGYSVYDQMDIN